MQFSPTYLWGTHCDVEKSLKRYWIKGPEENRKLSQKPFYEHSKKSGHLLAQALHAKRTRETVHQLKTPKGNTLQSNPDIAQEFKHFYMNFYNLKTWEPQQTGSSPRPTLIDGYLHAHCPRSLSPDTAAQLDLPILKLEWALKNLKLWKSPGPDGLSAVYYKTFTEILHIPYLKAFNSLSPDHPLTPSMLEAHISVIPKKEKTPHKRQTSDRYPFWTLTS